MNDYETLPVSIAIFGATGDLAHRKLIPALYNLYRKDRLPKSFQIIGFSNIEMTEQDFRASMLEATRQFSADTWSDEIWGKFSSHFFYTAGDFMKDADFVRLNDLIKSHETGRTGRLYYLATPPQFFSPIALALGKAGMLAETDAWRRVVIEKPFGTNLETARVLNKTLHQVLQEKQIYRIDHYLGKETVQNILVFRFGNAIFEPVWNHKFIDHVQITVAEQVGVEHRAAYYEKAGILRDMFQNHLMQLLSLIAVEPPDTLKHEDLHKRKLEVLRAIRPIAQEDVAKETIRGQYHGYLQEPGVAPDSQTATYAAVRLFIDNPRWKDVPFIIRSGKELSDKVTEIVIQFICTPYAVYPMQPTEQIVPDMLSFCIQPDEGVYLRFEAKVPDTSAETRSVEMEFHYNSTFGPTSIPEAYERLILDALHGDLTLFTSDEEAEQAWKFIDPIIDGWQSSSTGSAPPLEVYEPGSWGPESSARLFEKPERTWHIACGKQQDI